MKNILLWIALAALCRAAPPLDLEVRGASPQLVLQEDGVEVPDHPNQSIPKEDIDSLSKVRVIPRVEFEEIILTSPTEKPFKEFPSATTTGKVIINTPTDDPKLPSQSTPLPATRLSGKERKALISHLSDVDLESVEKLVLSPRQKLALTQELEYKRLGLPAFSDPTPWQRLSREEQEEFNKKYLGLRPELQEYSRVQFTSLPEERQEHAYRMFLHLDINTLAQVISRELERQQEAKNLFENEALPADFEELTFSQNTQQQPFESIQLFNDSQTFPSDDSQIHPTEIPIKFQISEQQLEQLQQELVDLDEPGRLVLQSQQENKQYREEVEPSSKTSQKLQLSPEHIQQIQQEIKFLEEPSDKHTFEETIRNAQDIKEDVETIFDEKDKTVNSFEDLDTNHNSTLQDQSDYPDSKEAEFMNTKHVDPLQASQNTLLDQTPFDQTAPLSKEQYEQSTNQPQPLLSNTTHLLSESQGLPLQQQEVELVSELPVPTQSPVTIQPRKEPVTITTTDNNETKVSALELLTQMEKENKEEISKEELSKTNRDDLILPFEVSTEIIQDFQEEQYRTSEKASSTDIQEEDARNTYENEGNSNKDEKQIPSTLSSKDIVSKEENTIKSPESIFFGQNKQIEELRKEFKLTAKHFSKKFRSKQNQTNVSKESAGPKWPKFPEVVPIKPQFLQPSTENPTQKELKSPKAKKDHSLLGRSKPFKIHTQVFHQEPESAELLADPIRHLQKISEDLKLRVSQPFPRVRPRPIFDPRIRQQQQSRKELLLQEQARGPTPAELKHFKQAEAQIAKAIRLQECINNPSSCQV